MLNVEQESGSKLAKCLFLVVLRTASRAHKAHSAEIYEINFVGSERKTEHDDSFKTL